MPSERTIDRPHGTHTIFLDVVTYQLVTAWLHERRTRWPVTTNPHLIISHHSAVDERDRPVAVDTIRDRLLPVGLQARALRADRILHEAAVAADPVHLIRLFGISAKTAMRYLQAAHPDRGSVLPR